jgi:hypothetical protein
MKPYKVMLAIAVFGTWWFASAHAARAECAARCSQQCDKARDACTRAGDLRRAVAKGRCMLDERSARQGCIETFAGALMPCFSLCEGTPERERCEADAHAALDACRKTAKDAREACEKGADPDHDAARHACDAARDACKAGCPKS